MSFRKPHLKGFEPLHRESNKVSLAVQGTMPSWLQGSLFRTGPARFDAGRTAFNHWFDGFSMLHRYDIVQGAVSYTNRFLQSETYLSSMRESRLTRRGFATDPCATLFERFRSLFQAKPTDNANVNIVRQAGEYLALTETPFPVSFDPETLHVLPRKSGLALDGYITTAHPQHDQAARKSYNYLLKFGLKHVYQITVTDDDSGATSVLADIPASRPSYVHSMGMSENYVVLVLSPLTVNPLALLTGLKPFIRNYRWHPECGLRFIIVDKSKGTIVHDAIADARFLFHHVNAFEQDDSIIADLITYPDAAVIDQLYLDRVHSGAPIVGTGQLARYTIPLKEGAITCRVLSKKSIELPRIQPSRSATDYRWVYGNGSERGDFLDSILKIDVQSGCAAMWYSLDCYPGEPVFIPAPDASQEDEGVLLSVVLDAAQNTSFLLVLDARSLTELARAEVGHHIPFGTHGEFFSKDVRSEYR